MSEDEPEGKKEKQPKTTSMKRPAAAEPALPRAYKSMYKDGKWGLKLKGAGEQLTARAQVDQRKVRSCNHMSS